MKDRNRDLLQTASAEKESDGDNARLEKTPLDGLLSHLEIDDMSILRRRDHRIRVRCLCEQLPESFSRN